MATSYHRSSSMQLCSEELIKLRLDEIKKYEWDIENLAFEGGGAKMIGYAGTVKVLDQLGILQNIKRFAGASGGAIAAALLAVGYTPDEMKELMETIPMERMLKDSYFGYLALLPNLFWKFGWNPGQKFLQKFRDIMKDKTGNPDITFKEVYKRYGKELCVIGTDVSTCSVEYFHPKTTPDIPVASAVRCSVSIPGLLQPVGMKCPHTLLEQLYVDGGVLCNYPLHAFDGYYLSMKKEDSFFQKLGTLENPFGTDNNYNKKTIGVLLYTLWEDELLKTELYKQAEGMVLDRPETPLAKARAAECDKKIEEYGQTAKLVAAAKLFLDILREVDTNEDEAISKEEFDKAVEKLQKHPREMKLLLGDHVDVKTAWEDLKRENKDDKVTMEDFTLNLQKRGIRFRQLLNGGHIVKPRSLSEFFTTMLSTSMNQSRKAHFKMADFHRTIGIFTDYIYTTDFTLQHGDIEFLIKQGVLGTVAYFEHMISQRNSSEDSEHQ